MGQFIILDLPTLTAAAAFATILAAVMLLLTWWRSRTAVTLGVWGAALVLVCGGGIVLALRGTVPFYWSALIGGDMLLLAYGLMWCAARLFEGRKPLWGATGAGAAVWTLACQSAAFMTDMSVRIVLFSLFVGAYTLMTASEYWRARDRTLTLRRPAIVLLSIHATLIALRLVMADTMPMPADFTGAASPWLIACIAAMLAHYVCMAFIVLAMAKERVASAHRREARCDPLTGIANRRAFFDSAESLLRSARHAGRPTALLLFDLDMFKHINDTFGHQTGDRVLCAFACTAAATLRPGDVLGRLGGEEFACLLAGIGAKQAMRIAERIRSDFAARATAAHGAPATVSVGVATTADVDGELDALIAAADRALYRAKAAGRDRVEQAGEPLPITAAA